MLILTSKNHKENAINGIAYYPIANIKKLSCEAKNIKYLVHTTLSFTHTYLQFFEYSFQETFMVTLKDLHSVCVCVFFFETIL